MIYGVKKFPSFCIFVLLLTLGMLQPALAASQHVAAGHSTQHAVSSVVPKKTPVISSTVSANHALAKNPCPCVVFRLDDVRGSYLSDVQTTIMDEFQKKNASLTLGVVGSDLHLGTKLVSYLKNHLKPGHAPIEITNHGWKHENFATQILSKQVSLLDKTNQELQKTLGKKPDVFVTPYGMYDNDTLKALKQLKMNTISSDMWEEDKFVTAHGKIVANKDSFGVYHVPSMTDFQVDIGNESYWTNIPKDKVLESLSTHVSKYGYDVILLHPQNFAISAKGKYVDIVDKASLGELSSILEYVKSKHIKITTLSDIVGLDRANAGQITQVSAKPAASKPITLASAHLATIVPFHNLQKAGQPHKIVTNMAPNGTLVVNLKYSSGDRIEAHGVSLKIYRDFDLTPYMELKSIPENPYTITSLPLYHQYKVVAYVEGMLSSANLVTLDRPGQDLDINTPDGGSMLVSVFYNDGQTPIPGANVSIKSQDNKTHVTGVTDSDGSLSRLSLPPTIVDGNYYVIDAKVSNHLAFSSTPVLLQPGDSHAVRLIAPWPSVVQNLVTVQVYNQTRLLSSSKQTFAVYLYDDRGEKVSESPISIHGEAYFWSMKVGDYVFKLVNTVDGKTLQTLKVTIDGAKNDFYMVMQKPAPTTKESSKI